MAAATHMVGSAHSSASISPPPQPWQPAVVLVPNHQYQALYDDLELVTPSPSPSPSTFPTTASPARHNEHEQQHLRPTSRREGKRRRPRPSRKLPTTYIGADAASFRRMVHQVTGADDVAAAHQDQAAATVEELLCRPAPPPLSRAASLKTTTTMVLPTLDTSALLFGAAERAAVGAGGATPARPASASCRRHGSVVPKVGGPGAALQAEEACGRGGVRGADYSCSYSNDDGSAAGRRRVPKLG